MSGFVDRHALGLCDPPRRQPPRAGREQHRVFHAARLALPGGIDDGDVRVRIGTEPLAVVAQRRARRVEVAFRLAHVLGLKQEAHRHRRQALVAESLEPLHVVRARRPGEVVDVLRMIVMRRRAIALVAPPTFDAGGPHDPSAGDRQAHVVDAEVREELRRGVELMAVPARVLKDANLGKPLSEEVVIANCSRAREGARDSRGPGDLHVDGFPRRHRRRERHFGHGAVIEVPVVWCDEPHGRGDVDWRAARPDELEARDVNPTPVRLGTIGSVGAARERALAHPRRPRVAPGVVVQVEAEARRRDRRGIAPGEELLAGQRAACRVEPCRNRVARVARRWRGGPRRRHHRRPCRITWLRLLRGQLLVGDGARTRQREKSHAARDACDGDGSPEHDGIVSRGLRAQGSGKSLERSVDRLGSRALA